MALDEAGWEALRADWCTGTLSNRELSRRYGVHESSIRERCKRRPDIWVRDPAAADRVHAEGRRRTLEDAVHQRLHAKAPQTPAAVRGRAGETVAAVVGEMIEEARGAIQVVAEEAMADLIAHTNLDHLVRAQRLKGIFAQHASLLEAALQPAPAAEATGEEAERGEVQRRALSVLLMARSDTLAGHIQSLVAMAERIQLQERRALSLDAGPRRLEVSGPNGGPIATANIEFRPEKLTTAQLMQLFNAAKIIEGNQERPPIPVPPGDDEDDGIPQPHRDE